MGLLSRDEILAAANKLEEVEFEVPGLGSVKLKALTSAQGDEWEQKIAYWRKKHHGTDPHYRARFIVKHIVDEKGVRLFKDEDASAFASLPSKVVRALFDRCCELTLSGKSESEELEDEAGPEEQQEEEVKTSNVPETL